MSADLPGPRSALATVSDDTAEAFVRALRLLGPNPSRQALGFAAHALLRASEELARELRVAADSGLEASDARRRLAMIARDAGASPAVALDLIHECRVLEDSEWWMPWGSRTGRGR